MAVRRIDNDNGRMIILIVSISTRNGVKIIGVFNGIKWAIKVFVFLYIDMIIKKNQNGIAIVGEKIIRRLYVLYYKNYINVLHVHAHVSQICRFYITYVHIYTHTLTQPV